MKIRLLTFALLLSASSVLAQTPVTITSVDKPTVATFATLTINGAGFDPSTAVSVILRPRGGITTPSPAYAVDARSVKFIVPPLVVNTTGNLFDVPVVVDVQVVQVSAAGVNTSNVLGGLTVSPLPQSSATPGRVTRAFLQMTKDLQSSVRTKLAGNARFSKLVATSQRLDGDLQTMIDAMTTIIDHPDQAVDLPTPSGAPMVLSKDALAASDRIAYGLTEQVQAQLQTALGTSSRKLANPPTCSQTGTGLPSVDKSLCELAVTYDNIGQNGKPMIQIGAAVTYGVPLALVGGQAAGSLGAAGLVSENAATAMGLLSGPAASQVAAYSTGATPPTVGSIFTDVSLSLADNFLFMGIPVISGTVTGWNMGADLEQAVNASSPTATSPKGLAIAAPPQQLPGDAIPVAAYQPTGISGTAKWLAVAATAQFVAFTTATIPPPTVARFNGLYGGSSFGSCTVQTPEGPISAGGGGAVDMTASSGALTITAGGTGTGTVLATGQVVGQAVNSGGITCGWGGRLWEDALGHAGGLGSFYCGGSGVSCSGTWNVARR